MKELGENTIANCNIPLKEDLERATKADPLNWNPDESYAQGENQPDSSFHEEKFAIQTCKNALDLYVDMNAQDYFKKSIGILGFPGSGKTWTMLYCAIYAISLGLSAHTTAMMAKRAIELGGRHWHYFFCLPIERHLSPHRRAELAITKVL